MTILQAIRDPQLFAAWFVGDTWRRWLVALAALFALPLDDLVVFDITPDEALAIYRHHTGRTVWPTEPAREFWGLMGRRAGKSLVLVLAIVYLAAFKKYTLAPGERATVALMASDKRQARVCRRYLGAFFSNVPLLKAMVISERADGLDLDNGVSIEIMVASSRSTRGYTYAAVIADEIAFFRTDEDSADPDTEILNAVRPGLATLKGTLICITSPYAKRGEVWRTYRAHWGQDGDVLVWKATTREMNPSIAQSEVDRAIERDAHAARSEWLGEFRDDVAGFVSREQVDALVDVGVTDRGVSHDGTRYYAHCDPSGGRADSMTLAIVHREREQVVLDAIEERRPPFDPEVVVADFSATLIRYGLHDLQTDNYSAEWCVSSFRRAGITVKLADRTTSQHYAELLPQITGARLRLLDVPRLPHQLAALERRVTVAGREVISHPPGGHDDLAAALAGAVAQAARPPRTTAGCAYLPHLL